MAENHRNNSFWVKMKEKSRLTHKLLWAACPGRHKGGNSTIRNEV